MAYSKNLFFLFENGIVELRNNTITISGPSLNLDKKGDYMNWDDLVEEPEINDEGKIMEWAGDPFQVGGTFVLGAGNTCDYVYRSSYAGDHVSIWQS